MTNRYATGTDEEREKAVSVAALSIQRGELIVMPTDTVYGLAADAFDADAVADLLEAKGRGREMPPPVLVSSATTLDALAVRVPAWARALVEEFWPGPLTLVCHQQTSLQWDIGDTRGTVAIRMPDHDIAREILERTGPLAVSSANLTGRPAAVDADQAEEMLGEEVAAIVDAGPSPRGEASTIVDATTEIPRVLREGALSVADLDVVLRPLGLALAGVPDDGGEPTVEPAVEPAVEPDETTEPDAEPTEPDAPADDAAPAEDDVEVVEVDRPDDSAPLTPEPVAPTIAERIAARVTEQSSQQVAQSPDERGGERVDDAAADGPAVP